MPRDFTGLPVVDYESLTGSASAQSLTKAKYDRVPPAVGAIVSVDTAPIRYRVDGTAPTSSQGVFAIPTGDPILLLASQLPQFQFINQSATNAVLRVHFLGAG